MIILICAGWSCTKDGVSVNSQKLALTSTFELQSTIITVIIIIIIIIIMIMIMIIIIIIIIIISIIIGVVIILQLCTCVLFLNLWGGGTVDIVSPIFKIVGEGHVPLSPPPLDLRPCTCT